MVEFREHKGMLADSMATVVEIKDKADLIEYIKKMLSKWNFNLIIDDETVKVEFYAYDKRINWNAYVITLKGYGVLGFTNGNLI